MTPPPTDLVDQLRHKIDEEAPPPAIVLPPASEPLSNSTASVVNTVEEEEGDNETDEEASDDDSDKGPTFIRSLGAWSKPLLFTPPPTPPEPATPSTLVENLEPCSGSLSTQQALETPEKSLITTPSEVSVVTPFTDSHEVHSTSCSEIDVTIPMLAAANVAPSNSPIMEAIPSQSIIVEDPSSSANEQQIDPTTPPTHNQQQFYRESEIPVTYGKGPGFDVVGEPSGYNLTRGGREIKPTQKFQGMEWTNVSGRGKRGRRGRGNHNH
ncbi:hypothetical protein Bca4012_002604 [Brassica carinata]